MTNKFRKAVNAPKTIKMSKKIFPVENFESKYFPRNILPIIGINIDKPIWLTNTRFSSGFLFLLFTAGTLLMGNHIDLIRFSPSQYSSQKIGCQSIHLQLVEFCLILTSSSKKEYFCPLICHPSMQSILTFRAALKID